MYKKQAEQDEVDQDADPSISHPVAQAAEQSVSTSTTTPSIVSTTTGMANRNKKKGFLKEMSGTQGMKTVFNTPSSTADAIQLAPTSRTLPATQTPSHFAIKDVGTGVSGQSSSVNGTPRGSRPNRIISPSEIDSLPENVFVSSMEFQAPPRNNRGRQSDTNGFQAYQYQYQENHEEISAEQTSKVVETTQDEPVSAAPVESASQSKPDESLLRTKVEIAFDAFEDLSRASIKTLPQGALIAWRVSRVITMAGWWLTQV